MTESRKILFCPHCNHPAPQHIVHETEYEEHGFSEDGTTDSGYLSICIVAVCETCSRIILYESPWGYLKE